MTAPAAHRPEGGPLLTLAWYAVVLVVVFTVAFWIGRLAGPAPSAPEPAPASPHAPAGAH